MVVIGAAALYVTMLFTFVLVKESDIIDWFMTELWCQTKLWS